MGKNSVSDSYLNYRKQVLGYQNTDMNLELQNDEQIYIAVFDIPTESGIVYGHTRTLALVFGLNTHIYFGNGGVLTGLEKNRDVMKAMQSLFISAPQVLKTMEIVKNFEYYDSENIRVYLKTRSGVHFKEINKNLKEDRFLVMLMENVLGMISKQM